MVKVRRKNHLIFFIIGVVLFLNSIFQVFCQYPTTKCATLYTAASFQGTSFSLLDDAKQPYLRHMKFAPQSVNLTQGCSLTVFDVYGNHQILNTPTKNLGWRQNGILDAACCQCGGCSSASNKLGGYCARLFENANCDSCSGFRLELKDGDVARNFGILNNKMTSVAVRPGCSMSVFSEPEFGGWRFNFSDSDNMMNDNWRNQISSAKCGCNRALQSGAGSGGFQWFSVKTTTKKPFITLPTVPSNYYPTTQRWITLPTVPTSRPPMTLPTVSTTRPPMTFPTVHSWSYYEPTTRRLITLPTVSTRPPMTLPTVPTYRPPITFPTVSSKNPSSTDSPYSYSIDPDDDDYDELEDKEDEEEEEEDDDDFWTN